MEYYSFLTYHETLGAWVVPAAIAAAGIIANFVGQNKQNKAQKALASHQAAMNERYLAQQNEYNSPKSQMTRYQEAGLNPHLIYGQGTPGNQTNALSAPQQEPSRYTGAAASIGATAPLINQSMMTQSQVQAIDAKTRHTYTLMALSDLQRQVLQKNPLLNDTGFAAIIDGLKSAAEIKAAESSMKSQTAEWFSGAKSFKVDGINMHGPAGVLKLETELKLLEQKFNLGTTDQNIKAEILRSKEFSNAILEVQKKWMTDAEVTPQIFLQFIQLLLMKML